MATSEQVGNVRLRQPSLPSNVTDATINIYLDDAAQEFPSFGIETSNSAYQNMLYLYAMHLMTMAGILKDISSESVKDVSASYNVGTLGSEGSVYYAEFKKLLRRRKSPFFILKST